MAKKTLRTISTCAGIGDSIWLFQKLINQSERFHWKIPAGQPQRGKQVFDLLPQIAASCEYSPDIKGYNDIKAGNAGKGKWSAIKQHDFFLEANTHLEAGKRIEEFLPDLPTSYTLQYQTLPPHVDAASQIVPEDAIYIGIYCSAYGNANGLKLWKEKEWIQFCNLLRGQWPEIKFIFLGAEYDLDLTKQVCASVGGTLIIGHPLGEVVEIMKRLDYFIGFPSGLSILNETLGKRGIMFYPDKLIKMMNAWAVPVRIESGEYKAVQVCAPVKLFDWIKENKKL